MIKFLNLKDGTLQSVINKGNYTLIGDMSSHKLIEIRRRKKKWQALIALLKHANTILIVYAAKKK